MPLAWQARLWPHFDRDFAAFATLYGRQCEQLAQRIHLDPDTSQRLAIDSAADRRLDPRPLCVDTLAYWLWRMAWEGTGSLRLLHAREHPPFGLAAWLAYAPFESAVFGGEAHECLAQALRHHLRESFEHARALVLWMRDERRLFMMPKLLAPQLWWLALKTPG